MNRLEKLVQTVRALYEAKTPDRNDWADWLYDQHLPFVAQKSRELSKIYGANPELAEAAAWLHDVADVKMKRKNEEHEDESLRLAKELLEAGGYSAQEIALIVDDAIRLHSCHDGHRPASLEGQVLATADALAHISTDFYIYAARVLHDEMSLDETKAWTLQKLERDFTHKICFEDIRTQARPDYEALRNVFSRPAFKN